MSILKPTLGELLDRYSIVLLKLAKDDTHELREEVSDLCGEVANKFALRGPLLLAAVRLGVTNARLWALRDDAIDAPVLLRDADAINQERRKAVAALSYVTEGD